MQTSKKPIRRSCFGEDNAAPAQLLLPDLGTSIQNGQQAGLSRVCRRFRAGSIHDLHDPEHEWAFLNNFNSSPVFSIANSLLHHPFKILAPARI